MFALGSVKTTVHTRTDQSVFVSVLSQANLKMTFCLYVYIFITCSTLVLFVVELNINSGSLFKAERKGKDNEGARFPALPSQRVCRIN